MIKPSFIKIAKNNKCMKFALSRFPQRSLLNPLSVSHKKLCRYRMFEKTEITNIPQYSSNLNKLLAYDWSMFFYNKRPTQYKKIQTRFRNIISDQKKRSAFDKKEVTQILLKSLLSVNFKAALYFSSTFALSSEGIMAREEKGFTRPFATNIPFAFAFCPLKRQKAAAKRQPSVKKNKGTDKRTVWKIKNRGISKYVNTTKIPSLGPRLILKKGFNEKFTKKMSITKLRNRCMLTGRSSVVGKFRLSRIRLRAYAGHGLIPGLIKKNN